jgi:hypothetical protein
VKEMKLIHQIDENNFLVRSDFIGDNETIPEGWTDIHLSNGLYKARMVDGEFVSSMTREEFESLNDTPILLTPEQQEIKRLQSQNELINADFGALVEALAEKGVL